jgi:hypothetical protein
MDAPLSGGVRAAVRYDEPGRVLLLPLVLRPIPDSGLRDAASRVRYPGPVSNVEPARTRLLDPRLPRPRRSCSARRAS